MQTLRQFLQPIRKSLFLRPGSPDSRRLRRLAETRRLADMRRAAARWRESWEPVPVPVLARTPRWPGNPHA